MATASLAQGKIGLGRALLNLAAAGLLLGIGVSELAASDHTLVFRLSTLGGNLFLAVVVHLLLAMPSGRLRVSSPPGAGAPVSAELPCAS